VFDDILEQIKVNINAINPCNLDAVINIDKFCQFGHTYASNFDLFSRFYLPSKIANFPHPHVLNAPDEGVPLGIWYRRKGS